MADEIKYLYWLAEGTAAVGSVRGESEDDAYDKFMEQEHTSPLRVLGVTKDDGKGQLECHVVWEDDTPEEDEDDTSEQEPCEECNNPIGEIHRSGLCDECLENHVAETFIKDVLDDPDDIGASEYRVLHELLDEMAGQMESTGKDQLKELDGSLDEIIGWANKIKADIAKTTEELYPEKK